MKKNMNVLAIDVALNNVGLVKARFNSSLSITDVGVIQNKTKKLKHQKQNAYDIQTTKNIFVQIKDWIEDVDMVIVELPVGSQSARAMVSYAVSMAVIGYIETLIDKVVYVSPKAVKAYVGNPEASKNDVINLVNQIHPNLLPTVKHKAEHIADAYIALLIGLKREFNYEISIEQ